MAKEGQRRISLVRFKEALQVRGTVHTYLDQTRATAFKFHVSGIEITVEGNSVLVPYSNISVIVYE